MKPNTTTAPVAPYTIDNYDEAVTLILNATRHQPRIGLVLGSGLSPLAEQVTDADAIDYGDIPHFPVSTVAGHAGRLVIGELAGASVCVMQGRFHFYEGYSLQQVTFPIRVMQRMGIDTLILTNAAGGANASFAVGDLMLIEDQISIPGMAGQNPLMGPNMTEFGTRFPAANRTYTKELRQLADGVAAAQGLDLKHGVYMGLSGPSFETPAEIRMVRILGGDSVGMSTVHEALVAHHAGMKVMGISTITNMAIDSLQALDEPTHEEVTEAGKIVVPRLTKLLLGILHEMAQGS